MQSDGYGSMFILHVTVERDQHPVSKMLFFPRCVSLPSVLKTSGYGSMGSQLHFTSNDSAFVPVQGHRC